MLKYAVAARQGDQIFPMLNPLWIAREAHFIVDVLPRVREGPRISHGQPTFHQTERPALRLFVWIRSARPSEAAFLAVRFVGALRDEVAIAIVHNAAATRDIECIDGRALRASSATG